MKIGIDLDNTLVCYDEVFRKYGEELGILPEGTKQNRSEIRTYIRNQVDGETRWQELQGQVYGKGLSKAKLFPGVHRFLWRCRQKGITVEIISHKTEYGHFDKSHISLHQVAIDFLVKSGIYTGEPNSLIKNVSFFTTRTRKLKAISDKKFDWFIDDLPEIFDSSKFPRITNKLGFDPNLENKFTDVVVATSWLEIDRFILGLWQNPEVASLANEIDFAKFQEIKWIGGRGNSGIYKVRTDGTRIAALKIYVQESKHDRLRSEYKGLQLLNDFGVTNIPRPIGCSRSLGVGLYDWIDGDLVNSPTTGDIDQALSLIEQLYEVRLSKTWKLFHKASAAVFSGQALEEQISHRFELLMTYGSGYSELGNYLRYGLKPIIDEIVEWGRASWPLKQQYREELPLKSRTLSPSDFGFHNALRNEAGEVIFIDWEYFGWDDPAKMVGDFLLHPGMNLSDKLKSKWLSGSVRIFGYEIMPRLRVMWPYLTLCWCLILLNEYRRDIWARRATAAEITASPSVDQLEKQLLRSKNLAESLAGSYREFPY